MGVDDRRLLATTVQQNGLGHPTEQVAERAEHAEPDRLVVGPTQPGLGVGKQRERQVVLVLPVADAVGRLRHDRDNLGPPVGELLVVGGHRLHLTPAVRAVVVTLEQKQEKLVCRRKSPDRERVRPRANVG